MKILFVTKSPPFPADIGGNQRSHLIHRALSLLGRVDLLLALPEQEESDESLARMREQFGLIGCVPPAAAGERGAWKLIRGAAPGLVDKLAHHLSPRALDYAPDPALSSRIQDIVEREQYDLVVGRQLRVFAKAGMDRFPRTILDVDDLDTHFYRSQVAAPSLPGWRRLLAKHHCVQLERLVPPLLRGSRALLTASATDVEEIEHDHVFVFPNIPFALALKPDMPPMTPAAKSSTIMTVASLAQRPNVDGIESFLRNAWPRILAQCPHAHYRIVGGGLRRRTRERWATNRNVEVVGYVRDLEPEYERCAFVVAPILWGGGTNIKVVEALAYGRTAVVTRFAHRGFEEDLPHLDALLAAGDEKEMAAGCIRLLEDPDLGAQLAERGAARVRDRYSPRVQEEALRKAVSAVMER